MPLVFGTLKGTFYAMLLAGPLALGAAAYVSHFTSPQVRAWIKPAIEMMAAVPSVVLGFLVGLWLAPLLNDWLLAFFLTLVSVPLCFAIFLLIWQTVRQSPTAEKLVRGREFLITALLIAVGLATAALLAGPLEQRFFGGDIVRWMSTQLGVVYVQRNSILIAFGVGFMVIPMIFTLSEDALSSVPHSMTAASMALGASRWQTLWRVVLPFGQPRHLRRRDDRLRPRRGRDDGLPHGHGQHADHRPESLQRHAHALGQHRRGDSRRAAERHALPHVVPLRRDPVCDDVFPEYRVPNSSASACASATGSFSVAGALRVPFPNGTRSVPDTVR